MTELEAHLRLHPDDWQSWLVYADYLQDQGDVRGEIIALSHQLETAAETDGLEARIASLTQEHLPRWSPELPPGLHLQWRFGFVIGVSASAGQELEAPLAQLAAHPSGRFLQGLSLVFNSSRIDEPLGGLDVWPSSLPLRALEIWCSLFRASWVPLILEHPVLREVRSLCFRMPHLSEQVVNALVQARSLGALEELGVLESPVGGAEARALLESEALSSLTRLALFYGGLGPTRDDLALFVQSRPPPRLRHLELRSCGFGPREAAALAEGSVLSSLHTLDLRDNALGNRGVSALVRSTHLQQLRSLDLSETRLGREGLAALGQTEALPSLRELKLSGNVSNMPGLSQRERELHHLGPDGLAALLAGPALRPLRVLDLSHNQLSDEAVAVLTSAETLANLEILDLTGNAISPEGAQALTRTLPSLRRLRAGQT